MSRRSAHLRWGIAILSILLIFVFFARPRNTRRATPEDAPPASPAVTTSALSAPGSSMPAGPQPSAVADDKETEFMHRLQSESWKIGQIDDDPEDTGRELDEWAQDLSIDEVHWLAKAALDLETEPDERFLAVDLLGRSGRNEAADDLVKIASEPLGVEFGSDPQHSQRAEFEKMLREQAVDSIAELPRAKAQQALGQVLKKVNSSTLVERIQRHQAALKKSVPPVKEQEDAALKKVLSF